MATSSKKSIESIFDTYASQYNQARRILIPCFDDFYKTAVEIIPFPPDKPINVLDLGAGTGILSSFIAAKYRYADISLIDVSKNMIKQAQESLARFPNNFSYHVGDYCPLNLPQKFDIIVSALSIHHLSAIEKKTLFCNIFTHLSPDGIFINADQVEGETPEIDGLYRAIWLKKVQENGADKNELAAALERMKEDRMSPLEAQLQWLKDTGFSQVHCWYKNYSFAVFSGRKTSVG